jgi:hypothetical protein
MRLTQMQPNLFETCLTGRSCLMIVYRLITNYSRRGWACRQIVFGKRETDL